MKNERMKLFWKDYAPTYGAVADLESTVRRQTATILSSLLRKEHPSIVELGCGNGVMLAGLSASFPAASVLGVDSSKEMLALAAAKAPAVTLKEEELELFLQAPENRNVFDAAVCVNTLHNLESPETIEAALRGLARSVRPGGYVAVDVRNSRNLFVRRGYAANRANGLSFHTFSPRRAMRILEACDVAILDAVPIYHRTLAEAGKEGKPFLHRSLYRLYLLLTRRSLLAPYVLIVARKREREFVSVIWGYHEQMRFLSPVEQYHAHALKVANELGYRCSALFAAPSARPEDDPHFPPGTVFLRYRGALRYALFLIRHRRAVVYANTFVWQSFIVPFICRTAVFMGHDSVQRKTRMKQAMQDFVLRRFARIRVISEEEKQFLIAHGSSEQTVHVVPLAIDVARFDVAVPDTQRNGIVFLGNVTPDKDIITILKSFAHARVKFADCKLTVIGEVRDARMAPLVQELNLVTHVEYRGFVDHEELPRELGRFVLYVNSSISEGQCLAAYESALSGLALCLPKTLSFSGVFRDKALFHELHDETELANDMVRYLADAELRETHNRKCRELIAAEYAPEVVEEKMANLFSF